MYCSNLTLDGCAHLTSLTALTDLRLQFTSISAVDAQDDEDGVSSLAEGSHSSVSIHSKVSAGAWLRCGVMATATATASCAYHGHIYAFKGILYQRMLFCA
jgi:hypothetical protein